jgi:hypothetical protein
LVLAAAVGSLALAGTASAAKIHGIVVAHNSRAHSFVIAERRGKLVSVHARRSPKLGRVVLVRAKELRNGTFALRHVISQGRIQRRFLLHGVVTFVNRRRHEFTVSAGGASLLVRRHRASGRAAGTAGSGMPSVGDDVTVESQLDDQGDLEDDGVQQTGTQTQNIEVEGTVLSIDTNARTLTISADGDDDTNQSITVDVPPTIDISTFTVGQEVELNVAVQPDGSFLLQGSSEDDNSEEANNPGDQQGCQSDGPDNSCSQSGSDGAGSSGGDGSGSDGSGSGD